MFFRQLALAVEPPEADVLERVITYPIEKLFVIYPPFYFPNYFKLTHFHEELFLRQSLRTLVILGALGDGQLACLGRQPRSGDGHQDHERQ